MNDKELLRALVRGAYDVQKLRIQTGLRIVANWKTKLGQSPGGNEEEIDEKGQEILVKLRAEYSRLSDAVVGQKRGPKNFEPGELISSQTEFALVRHYIELDGREKEHFKAIGKSLESFNIFPWLNAQRGIGPAMAGVLISEIDISAAKYASSLWKYAGLDTVQNTETGEWEGRRMKKEHFEPMERTTMKGELVQWNGPKWNHFLKTKLMGVLAGSFLKAKHPVYEPIYRNYKHRLESHPVHSLKTKGHRNQMALRYMIKQFLADFWREWRTVEGLTTPGTYAEDKLGMVHGEEKVA